MKCMSGFSRNVQCVQEFRTIHAAWESAFTEKGIKHLWSEDAGYGHDYQIWRIYLHTLLQKTFRD